MAGCVGEKVKGFASVIVDGIKGFLGIHSPSTVFAEIGDNIMVLGLGNGFGDSMKDVTEDIKEAIPTNLYAKYTPLPDGYPQHRIRFDEERHIYPSACWFPDLTVQREVDGAIYSVSAIYDGSETLDKKLTGIMGYDAKNLEENE